MKTSFELRKHARELTLLTGTISDSSGSIDCAILDLSPDGACLLVPADAIVPASFALAIDGSRSKYACEVRWRAGSRVGVDRSPL